MKFSFTLPESQRNPNERTIRSGLSLAGHFFTLLSSISLHYTGSLHFSLLFCFGSVTRFGHSTLSLNRTPVLREIVVLKGRSRESVLSTMWCTAVHTLSLVQCSAPYRP